MLIKRNLLVQYQGGGYSGCIWEWNFFYLDADGKFHDIYSSGTGAITEADKALELIQGDGAFYVYDINCPTSLNEFAKETHPNLVKMVVQWFYDNQDNEVYALCSKCGDKIFDPDELLDIEPNIMCEECWSANSCSYCGRYVELENDLVFSIQDIAKTWDVPERIVAEVIENYAPLCGDCCEGLLNKELDKIIKERNI